MEQVQAPTTRRWANLQSILRTFALIAAVAGIVIQIFIAPAVKLEPCATIMETKPTIQDSARFIKYQLCRHAFTDVGREINKLSRAREKIGEDDGKARKKADMDEKVGEKAEEGKKGREKMEEGEKARKNATMGSLYLAQGRLDEAEKLFEESLRVRRETLGIDTWTPLSPSTIWG